MSWNWNEELEEREYETKGTVTISTEEYRDMLKQIYSLQSAGQKEHDDWYSMMKERDALKTKFENADTELTQIKAWLEDDDASKTKFKLWKVEQEEKE